MPLIIKNLSIDSPEFSVNGNGENDFIQDPDQLRDELPQPYRMINKVLGNLLDAAWEESINKENQRIVENAKVKPPKYDCGVELTEFSDVSDLADSCDGRFIFSAFPGGISMMNASTMQLVHTHKEEGLTVSKLTATLLGVQTYLLTVLSETGILSLYICFMERIFFVQTIAMPEAMIAVKCEPSAEGGYMGVALEKPSSGSGLSAEGSAMLEVHLLPQDAWLKELEGVEKALTAPPPCSNTQDTDITQEDGASPGAANTEEKEGPSPERGEASEEMTEGAKDSGPPKLDVSFTHTNVVLRVKSPSACNIQPNPFSCASDCAKVVTDTRVLGTGSNHLMNKMYLELRSAMFKHTHQEILKNVPEELDLDIPEVTFHFITPGVIVPIGSEVPSSQSKPNHIMVWWSNTNQVMFYCLNKPAKGKKPGDVVDAERTLRTMVKAQKYIDNKRKRGRRSPDLEVDELELKPDVVWPHSTWVSASCVSKCSTLIAIGTEGGSVNIWDKRMGVLRKSVKLDISCAVTELQFLDPCVCPQANNEAGVYPTSTSCYVLIRCKDSSLHLLNCGLKDPDTVICVLGQPEGDDDKITSIHQISGLPELVLASHKNGTLYLLDVIGAKVLCQVSLPSSHELVSPWSPTMAIGAFGEILYVKARKKEKTLTVEGEEESEESLHAFQFRSFPTLDSFWKRKREEVPFYTHVSLETRCEALFKDHIQSSAARKSRLQQRWPLMKQRLLQIQQMAGC